MPFSLQFLGVGGAFAMPTIPGDLTTSPMQSNMVITASSGKRMLFDCGTDIRFSAQMCDFDFDSFDAIYISHEHADHIGGLEWLLHNRLFSNSQFPHLYAEHNLFWRIWKSLRAGLMITTKGQMKFGDFVQQCSIHIEDSFLDGSPAFGMARWEDLRMKLVSQVHVKHRTKPMFTYGIILGGDNDSVYITSDTLFDAEQIVRISADVDTIFQDCEVIEKTGVHTTYNELLTLPADVRAKMWLYHYNPADAANRNAVKDGFRGFVQRGQTFEFD